LVRGKREIDADETFDLGWIRLVDREAVGHIDLDLRRHLAKAVCLLLTEAEPEPGVDELRVGRGNQDIVSPSAGFNPARSRRAVEVAHELGLARSMAGDLDPDVRPP